MTLWLYLTTKASWNQAVLLRDILAGALGSDVAEHARENSWLLREWNREQIQIYIDGWWRRDALLRGHHFPTP